MKENQVLSQWSPPIPLGQKEKGGVERFQWSQALPLGNGPGYGLIRDFATLSSGSLYVLMED